MSKLKYKFVNGSLQLEIVDHREETIATVMLPESTALRLAELIQETYKSHE